MSCDEYLSLPIDGKKSELIDGEIVMSPSYNSEHSLVMSYLISRLYPFVVRHKLGAIFQDLDVVMEKYVTVLRPDISFVGARRHSIIRGHIQGAPDFAIEITSPGNRETDLHAKRDRYEQFGVREYWVLDIADSRDRAYQWVLRHGNYHGGIVTTPKIESHVLKGFSVKLSAIWKAKQVG